MLLSLAAGIGALLALERGDLRGDIGVAVLTGVSLASSGIGVPIALGLAAELLWARRRLTRLWVVAVPLAGYAAWWLAYSPGDLVRHRIVLDARLRGGRRSQRGQRAHRLRCAVRYAAGHARLGAAARRGGGGVGCLAADAPLAGCRRALWAAHDARVPSGRSPPLRAPGPSYGPTKARYLYVGGLLLLLLAVELAQGVDVSPRVRWLLAVAVGVVVLANSATFATAADAAGDRRRHARQPRRAGAGASRLVRGRWRRASRASRCCSSRPTLTTGRRPPWVTRASADELASAPEPARAVADAELRNIHGVALHLAARRPAQAAAGRARNRRDGQRRRIVRHVPAEPRLARAEPPPSVDLTLPAAGLTLTAEGGAATVAVRRFATTSQPIRSASSRPPVPARSGSPPTARRTPGTSESHHGAVSLRAARLARLVDTQRPEIEPDPADPGRWGHSLVNLAEILIPCLDAAEARSVVEIGAYAGDLTAARRVGGGHRCSRVGDRSVAAGAAGAPRRAVSGDRAGARDELRRAARSPARRRRDPRRRPQLPHGQRRAAAGRGGAGRELPLLIFHDVGWPHGRRDNYFDADAIPEEHRQPIAPGGGLFPGDPGMQRARSVPSRGGTRGRRPQRRADRGRGLRRDP